MEVTGAKGVPALATALGVSHQTVYSARKSGVPPSWVFDIAKRYGASADWLFFGIGNKFNNERFTKEQSTSGVLRCGEPLARFVVKGANEEHPCSVSETFTQIPMFKEARISAGHGSFEASSCEVEYYAFRTDFLRRLGTPVTMVMMAVSGDSMDPVYKDKDLVMIDRSQTDLRPSKVYAVTVEGLTYLKIITTAPGKLILSSYNSAYPPIEVPIHDGFDDMVQIIGRAVWFSRDL